MRAIALFPMVVLAAFGLAESATAAETTLKQVKLEGVVYANYAWDLSDGALDKNGFDIQRMYLIAQENLAEKVAFRMTMGIYQNTKEAIADTTGATKYGYYKGWAVRLKHAYVTFKEVFPRADVSFGMVDLPWVPFEEKIFQHRFVSTVFMDTEKKLTSTDLGVTLRGALPQSYGEYHVAVMNGETYAAPEVNKFKDYHARVTIVPAPGNATLKGLRLSAFGNFNDRNTDQRNTRAVAYASYEHARFTIAGGNWWVGDEAAPHAATVRSGGPSVYGLVKFTPKTWAMARWDQFDPNKDKVDDGWNRTIAGVGVQLADGVKLFLDVQAKRFEKETTANRNTTVAFGHFEIKY
ncbi:MAG: hypothetical protein HZC42_11265 [Candidatus Eisenbacteria bacterium]|nr:hypothetical protein [Candidatus Eisenbacteria bacterium]